MPPKRKIVYEDEDEDVTSIALPPKKTKACNGNLGNSSSMVFVQTIPSNLPRRLNVMDVATEEEEVNPMVPAQPQLPAAPKPRPKPKVIVKSTTVDNSQLPPSPAFSLAAPGQQFGFRLPFTSGSRQSQHGNHRTPDLLSNTSGPPSSHTGSMGFSALSHGTSTAPISRAPSVSSRGDFDPDKRVNHASQPVSGHSSHLRMLALASLTSQAPPHSNTYSQEDHRPTHPQLGVQPAAQDLFNDELGSLPPCPVGLRRTTSFYNQPLVVQPGHSIYATPDVEQDDDPLIDETSPSDDERSAEAVICNGSTLPQRRYQILKPEKTCIHNSIVPAVHLVRPSLSDMDTVPKMPHTISTTMPLIHPGLLAKEMVPKMLSLHIVDATAPLVFPTMLS
ncbi:hypothetical protein BDN67DRAFT_983505 [Paxillus ammoniavirescens]|nr:hypothetical protein BDN67DRAFT_983505 [Paxillus ammoniavirescens]